MSAPVLGVDPGAHGAAVLLPTMTWWAWAPSKAKGQPGWLLHSAEGCSWVASFAALGAAVAEEVLALAGGPVPCVLEGLFARGSGSITLAERCGELLGGLRPCVAALARPLAGDRRRGRQGWRRQVLGLSDQTGAAAAEGAAIARARREGWLPRGLSASAQGAVAEAGLMALWREPETSRTPQRRQPRIGRVGTKGAR